MLLKHWHFALIIFIFLTTSCEGDKNETTADSTPLFPVGKEFNVSLDIAPFLEVDEQPLGRSVASSLPGGLYAVNVFWKGKSLTSFQPYASGLFDDPYRVDTLFPYTTLFRSRKSVV